MSTILVVEDDTDLVTLLRRWLERGKHAVEHAGDGQAALDALKTDPLPSLVVLDVMLPKMDGFEVLRRLLAETRALVPRTSYRRKSSATSLFTTRSTAGASCTCSSTTKNSSPPSRATRSLARRLRRTRFATSCRKASPAAWPWRSLICLKPSRSMKRPARRKRLRRARSIACSSAGPRLVRLARPVSGSV